MCSCSIRSVQNLAELAAVSHWQRKTTNERNFKLTSVLVAMLGECPLLSHGRDDNCGMPVWVCRITNINAIGLPRPSSSLLCPRALSDIAQMTPPWTRDDLTYIRPWRSGLDPRTALFVLNPVTQAEIGDIVCKFVPPPSIRQQYMHASYAACSTRCTSLRWSTTPPTRSVCGGSATGSHRRPRIDAHCPQWPAGLRGYGAITASGRMDLLVRIQDGVLPKVPWG